MDVVVVLAHPVGTSFNHAIAQRAASTLERNGHRVHLLDLYALGFRAAMSRDERLAYETPSPLGDPMALEHAELVKATDALVVIYPTWWGGMPAILKGWLERVLVPGVAFRFDDRGKVRPGMQHLRHLVGISTYGSPWPYVKFVNDNGRRTLMRTIRLNTGLRTKRRWLGLYAIDTATAEQRDGFLAKVEQALEAM